MGKQIAIKDLKLRGFTGSDLEDVSEAFRLAPINGLVSIIIGRTEDGDEKIIEYRKDSDTHVTPVRRYNRS